MEKTQSVRNEAHVSALITYTRSSRRHLLIVAILLLAIPLTVSLALTQQDLRERASGVLTPITPPDVTTYSLKNSENDVSFRLGTGYAVYSILYKNGSVVTDQSDYSHSWSIDNSNIASQQQFTGCTYGIQQPCPYDHNTLYGVSVGQTVLRATVIRVSTGAVVASSSINVKVTNNTPTTVDGKNINWKTAFVSLIAKDASIEVGKKKYLVKLTGLEVHSSPTSYYVDSSYGTTNYDTTLEGTWVENGVEMRMYMYFTYVSGQSWYLSDLRTYNGNVSGDWVYYDLIKLNKQNPKASKPLIGGNLGQPFVGHDITFTNETKGNSAGFGKVHFGDITVQPFLDLQPIIKNIYPTADSYVSASEPTKNFGSSADLKVDGKPLNISYLKFDLSSISSANVIGAKLRIHVKHKSKVPEIIRNVTNTSWGESTITYNNKPVDQPAIIAGINSIKDDAWIDVDLTNYVKANKGKVVSLDISSNDKDDFVFESRNSKNTPVLIITSQP